MKQITYEIDIETLNSQKNVKQLDKEISNLIDGINELNETNNFQKKELQALEEKYKSLPKTALQTRKVLMKDINMLRTAIKENNNALEGFRIKKQQLGKLKSDLKKSEKYFTDTTDQVFKFAKSIGSATAGLILLGGGSEETAKKFEKAGGVLLAFSGVLDSVKSGYKVFNNIIKTSTTLQKANNTINIMAATVMKAFGASVNTTSFAFKGLRAAIISTGVGALVVGVGLLVANFDKLKAALTGISKAQKERTDAALDAVIAADKELKLSKLQLNNLRLQGKTEEQIVKFQMEALRARIEAQQKLILEQKKLNNEQLTGTTEWNSTLARALEIYVKIIGFVPRGIAFAIQNITKLVNDLFQEIQDTKIGKFIFGDEKIDLNVEAGDFVDSLIGDVTSFVAGLIFDPEAVKEQGEKELEELELANAQMLSELQGFELELKNIQIEKDKDKDKDKEVNKTKVENDIKLLEHEKFLQAKKDLEFEYLNSLLSLQQQEEDAVTNKFDNIIEKAKEFGLDTTILEEARQHELDKIREKFAEKERQDRLARINEDIELTAAGLNSIQALGDAVFAHKMKNLDKESKEGQKVAEKQFKFNKALQLGLAVVDGAKAVTASLAAAPVAILGLPNPAGIASLAFAITTSAAQIATIAAQKFQPNLSSATSPSASSPSGVSESQAPQFNIVGDSAFNQIAGALNQPIQAFVVAQDVTTAQQLDNGIITSATLGGG